jgi:competence protein ComGC
MKKQHPTRGFNLIEIAIVLGIAGLVIGGIWIAANAVQANIRKSDGSKGLVQIVQNTRNLFANQSPAVDTDIVPELISARAIPADYARTTTATNPWGGAVTVALSGPGPANMIDVAFAAMPREVCIELATRNTAVSGPAGLTQLRINNGSSTATITNFPYLPATATTDCGALNTLTWSFTLR